MATLTESATWTTGIYQLERLDQWDAGTGGNGVANQREKELANRTVYLKTEIEKRWNREHFQIVYSDQTIATASTKLANGAAYALLFPLGNWDYATPNDGITKDYIVTLGCHVGTNFTYDSAKFFEMKLIRSTAGPTLVEIAIGKTAQPGTNIFIQRKVSLPPNEKVVAIIINPAYAVTVDVKNAFFRIEEVIKA